MDPRDELIKKNLKMGQDKTQKSRFAIVKLEERIAPNKGGMPNGGSGGHDCHHDPICK